MKPPKGSALLSALLAVVLAQRQLCRRGCIRELGAARRSGGRGSNTVGAPVACPKRRGTAAKAAAGRRRAAAAAKARNLNAMPLSKALVCSVVRLSGLESYGISAAVARASGQRRQIRLL